MKMLSRLLPALMALALAACGDEDQATAPTAGPRPVLTEIASTVAAQTIGFSGTVEPRYETTLAFRSLGRVVSLSADIGDQVEDGEELARIDAETLKAAVRRAEAQLGSARAQAENARASYRRAETLFKKNTVSSADFEAAEQARASAVASVTQARADLTKAQNALSYALLTAPFAGVVTAREADIGQVVSAGETVMKLARVDVREAVVDIPGDLIETIGIGSPFRVRLQIDPAIETQGKVREIAPEADALTRTNRVRILLDTPPPSFRLGSLITARAKGGRDPVLMVPGTAIVNSDGAQFVWVVKAGVAHRRKVETGAPGGARIVIRSGLEPGERVAVAGVHSLEEGQAVSLSGDERP